MTRTFRRTFMLAALAVTALTGCRDYQYQRHVSDQAGLIPADQYARYGREQAITVAIGREFARPYNSGPEAQAEVTINYARNNFGEGHHQHFCRPAGEPAGGDLQEWLADGDCADQGRQVRERHQDSVLGAAAGPLEPASTGMF